MSEYYAIKWIDENIAERRTREVLIRCTITKGDIFLKDNGPVEGFGIHLEGNADTEHHLVEDAAILLSKMAKVKCGADHG